MRALFRQFSFPGGIPSHVAPETPGIIHEGGELGYALSHAFGAAFDNPELLVVLRRRRRRGGDGPARDELALQQVPEPGARRRGAAHPAPQRLQDRRPHGARAHPARGARAAHARLRLRPALRRGRRSRRRCTSRWPRRSTRSSRRSRASRPRRGRRGFHGAAALADDRAAHAQGLDRPQEVDGKQVEGTFRAHQVPLAELAESAAPRRCSRSG